MFMQQIFQTLQKFQVQVSLVLRTFVDAELSMADGYPECHGDKMELNHSFRTRRNGYSSLIGYCKQWDKSQPWVRTIHFWRKGIVAVSSPIHVNHSRKHDRLKGFSACSYSILVSNFWPFLLIFTSTSTWKALPNPFGLWNTDNKVYGPIEYNKLSRKGCSAQLELGLHCRHLPMSTQGLFLLVLSIIYHHLLLDSILLSIVFAKLVLVSFPIKRVWI